MPNPIPPLTNAIKIAVLTEEVQRLHAAIKEHWSQKADDRCIEDDDKLYAAIGLPPPDRHVGDKTAMLANCARFIEKRCEGGKWPSYVELEAQIASLTSFFSAAEIEALSEDPDALRSLAEWHSAQETMADAFGAEESMNHHEIRKSELRHIAIAIEITY